MMFFNRIGSKKYEEDKDEDEKEYSITRNYWNGVSMANKSNKGKVKKKRKTTETSWDLEDTTIDKCPSCEEKVHVLISRSTKHKIQAMMDVMGKDEWLGLLIGQKQDENWYISNLYIPKQEVSSVTATKKAEEDEPDDVLGIIHSHHDMGTFWSGTDEKHANSNFDLSIVVDSDMKTLGTAREKTECGKLMKKEVDIEYEDEYLDQYEWANEQKDDKTEKKYVSSYSKYSRYGGYSGYKYDSVKLTDDDDDEEEDEKEVVAIINEKKDRLDNEERDVLNVVEYYVGKDELEILATQTKGIPLIGNPNDKKTLDFDDWLSIYYEYEFKHWEKLTKYVKKQIMKLYLNEVAENDDEMLLSNELILDENKDLHDNESLIPKIERSDGKLFSEWLKENKKDAYENFGELKDKKVGELVNDFEMYVEYYVGDNDADND